MIKKLTLFLIISSLLVSCGKKGDPEYKDSEKKPETQNIHISKA